MSLHILKITHVSISIILSVIMLFQVTFYMIVNKVDNHVTSDDRGPKVARIR